MHRLVIACLVFALMAQGAGAKGQTMDCAQETDYLITPDIVQNNEVFHLVVIGDSIAWGAGLQKDKKYSYLVAEWLSIQLKRPINVEILAQTGATINTINHPEWAAPGPRTWENGGPLSAEDENKLNIYINHPDLTSEKPTVMEQADSISNPTHVDLILISGGINDVMVDDILKLDHLESPKRSMVDYLSTGIGKAATDAFDSLKGWVSTCSEEDLRQKTGKIKPLMQDLLNKLLTKCPRATIIVTGYYPIISEKSAGLTDAIKILKPVSQWISDYQKLDDPDQRKQLSDKSNAFYDESTKNLEAAVQDTKSKRVAFARIEFKPENCYGADESWLWKIESGQTNTDDPLYECRVSLIGDRDQLPPPMGDKYKIDKVVTVGRPNGKGARQYFSVIREAIEKTSPEFLPNVEDLNVASPTTRAPGES